MKTLMKIQHDEKGTARDIVRVPDQKAAEMVAKSTTKTLEDGLVVVEGWFYVPKNVWKFEVRDRYELEPSLFSETLQKLQREIGFEDF